MKLFTQTSGRHRVTAKQCCHYNCVHNESCFLVTPDAQEQATLWLMESKLEFVFIVRTRLWRRIHYLEGFLFISRLFHCFLRLQTRLWRASLPIYGDRHSYWNLMEWQQTFWIVRLQCVAILVGRCSTWPVSLCACRNKKLSLRGTCCWSARAVGPKCAGWERKQEWHSYAKPFPVHKCCVYFWSSGLVCTTFLLNKMVGL